MTTLYPRAVWREVTNEANDPPIIPVGVILHVSASEAGSLFGYFDGPSSGIESHLHIAREPKPPGGGIEQYRDLENEADANYHGNSWIGGDGRRYGFLSVETQGTANGPWGAYQLDELARFLAWASARFGFPLTLCQHPKDPGVGWHVMWGAPGEWTPAGGKVCPGPDRIAQVPALIARAREYAAGQPAPPEPPSEETDEMPTFLTVTIPPAPRDETTGDLLLDGDQRPLNLTPIGLPQPDSSGGIKVGAVWVSLYAVVPGSAAPFNAWAERSGGDGVAQQVWPGAWVRSYNLRARSSARLPAGTHGLAIAHDCPNPVGVLIEIDNA